MQYASWALDCAWFAGSTALLVSLPILIELQRETTVMVLQRQREFETQQMHEQAKLQNAGVFEQVKQTANVLLGGRPTALGDAVQ
jgi:hypothetical protein